MTKRMPPKKVKAKRASAVSAPLPPNDRLETLAAAIAERRRKPSPESRTGKLIAGGLPKMAQKLVEEAAEVAIDAVRGERASVIQEAADLFYNLTVLLSELGIQPAEVWAEMDRRQALYGIAEKLAKPPADRD